MKNVLSLLQRIKETYFHVLSKTWVKAVENRSFLLSKRCKKKFAKWSTLSKPHGVIYMLHSLTHQKNAHYILLHLKRAIVRTRASTHATGLMRVKNSSHRSCLWFSFSVYFLFHLGIASWKLTLEYLQYLS